MSDLPNDPGFRRRVKAHRASWRFAERPAEIEVPGPGQESVWDYPRPPEVRPAEAPLKVVFGGEVIAQTTKGKKVVETAGAPVYHFPKSDVRTEFLYPVPERTYCEWKGEAHYFDLRVGEKVARKSVYCYPDPLDDLGRRFFKIAGWFVFYAGLMDEVWVGEEQASPQPGRFYAGWVTSRITGPIKGGPGSEGW